MSDRDEDAIWLEALSRKSDGDKDSRTEKEAQLIAAALARRAQELEKEVPEADSTLLSRILFKLRKDRAFAKPGLPRVPLWLLAASVVLAVAITLELQPRRPAFLDGTTDLTSVTTKITASAPTERALQIVADLLPPSEDSGLAKYLGSAADERASASSLRSSSVGQQTAFVELDDGRVVLVVDASGSAIETLESQGIDATVIDGMIILIIEKR